MNPHPSTPPLHHNPDCEYWHDQYSFECTCGLTGGKERKVVGQEPLSEEQWQDLLARIRYVEEG
jgi:hypothetical protein